MTALSLILRALVSNNDSAVNIAENDLLQVLTILRGIRYRASVEGAGRTVIGRGIGPLRSLILQLIVPGPAVPEGC